MTECPKKRYSSRVVAKKIAKRMRRGGERDLSVYWHDCGAWHIGHHPRSGRAMLKSRREGTA